MQSPDTVTITLSAQDAWWMKSACFDSYLVWMQLEQEVIEGKRHDLDLRACQSLKERALRFAAILKEAGAEV